MPRLFAIGDIHGCSKTFRTLLLEKLRIEKTDSVYCLGDYVDRGPDSKGVIDLILQLRQDGYHIHTLRGNHEEVMMESVLSPEHFNFWRENGGLQTLNSFGADTYDQIDTVYHDFLTNTKFLIRKKNFILVHAGLDFENADPFQNKVAMLWIRDFEVDYEKLGDRILIHGHSPRPYDFIMAQENSRVINLDGGCVYPNRPGHGHLFGLELNEMKFYSVRNLDM